MKSPTRRRRPKSQLETITNPLHPVVVWLAVARSALASLGPDFPSFFPDAGPTPVSRSAPPRAGRSVRMKV